jgi:hypothetical protein
LGDLLAKFASEYNDCIFESFRLTSAFAVHLIYNHLKHKMIPISAAPQSKFI